MISSILSRLVILLFGTLYPAYASYKAVRTKNVKEYVKWMMYWIVFALFTCIETFTDVFLSWFPFYYEIKIVLVIWLLSPATKGSSILYRKFVHPMLSSREQEIDDYITKAKEQSYRQVLDLGSKGVSALMQTAIKGGGGIVNQLKKSYSLSDLTDSAHDDGHDETDVLITDPRLVRRRRSPHVGSSSTSNIYFSEVDVRADRIASIQSAEDISSGYSSGEGLYAGQPPKLLAREGLQRTGSLTRSRTTRVTRSTIIKKSGGSDDSDENEVFDTNIIFLNDKAKKIDNLVEDKPDPSSSEDEFLDTLDTLHDNKKLGENLNNFNKSSDKSPLLTACLENQQDLDVVKYSLTKNSSFAPSIINETPELKENVEIHEKKILNVEDNLNIVNITKDVDTFSNFLQNLIESKAEQNETTNSQGNTTNKDDNTAILKTPQQSTTTEITFDKVKVEVHPPSDKGNQDKVTKKDDSTAILTAPHKSTTIEKTFDKVKVEVHPSDNKDNQGNVTNEDVSTAPPKSSTTERVFDKVKIEAPFDKDIKEPLAETENRGGKYNKKAAPPPPKSNINLTEPHNTPVSPIKATLILKPGVVKNLGSKESLSKEVFIQSPKSKRRNSVHRSPSSVSTSSNSSKTKHSLSKLMRLPKKIGFWNKDDLSVPKAKEKRSSWHCSFDDGLKPLSDSKLQSKSDNDLAQIVPLHGPNMPRSGSQVSIQSLTESPLAHRRLKIIRRYVDEDID